MKTAFVLSASSDIGRGLCERLLSEGWSVIGTFREAVRDYGPGFAGIGGIDLRNWDSIDDLRWRCSDYSAWDLFISAAGAVEPIGPLLGQPDFDAWEQSVVVNSLAQLRVLHALWPYRRRGRVVDVMFMAGGGTNGPFTNFSAYCLGKIALVKAVELLHDEEPDINAFIIGPGYVKTKIHEATLAAGERAGENLKKTKEFLSSGDGTPLDDIYAHMKWCMSVGRDVIGGRNTATIHDPWAGGNLSVLLRDHPDAYRLRRKMP